MSLDSNLSEERLIEDKEEAIKAQKSIHEIAVEVFDENQKKIRLNELARNPRFRGDMKQGRKEYTKLLDQRRVFLKNMKRKAFVNFARVGLQFQ